MITPTLATAVYIYNQRSDLASQISWQTELLKVLKLGVVQQAAQTSFRFQMMLAINIEMNRINSRYKELMTEIQTTEDQRPLLMEATRLLDTKELAVEMLEALNAR